MATLPNLNPKCKLVWMQVFMRKDDFILRIILIRVQLTVFTFIVSVDLISYLTKFEWDMAKYPIKQPLKNISEGLAKVITLFPHFSCIQNYPYKS